MPTKRSLIPLLLAATGAWVGPARADSHETKPDDPIFYDGSLGPVMAIDCEEHQDVGYVKGEPFDITVVTVDGKPVEVQTANAYFQMQEAAAADGVGIKVVSGFRTMAEQEYLYDCYINCSCNNCNLAAKPGFSNHQSGHALDLNTGAPGVYDWLEAHGDEWGFERTVPSEDWHWEWWGGGPPASGPCGTPDYRAKYVAQSFPPAAEPAIEIEVGTCVDAWIDLENTGDLAWDGDTRLAPTPRDVPSSLHDPNTWLSATRIASAGMVAPGQVGHFAFRLCPSAPGEVFQTFGLVQEGVTWFSDAPLGGGPPDDQLEVRIMGIEPPPPPPPPDTTSTSGDPPGGTSGGSGGDDTGGASGTGGEGGSGGSGSGGSSSEGGPDSAGEAPASAGQALPPSFGSDEDGCGCRGSSGGAPALLLLALFGRRRRR